MTSWRDRFPRARRVAIGEGWAAYAAEADGRYFAIVDSGTMADFLDPEDEWMTRPDVRAFADQASRDRFIADQIGSARDPADDG